MFKPSSRRHIAALAKATAAPSALPGAGDSQDSERPVKSPSPSTDDSVSTAADSSGSIKSSAAAASGKARRSGGPATGKRSAGVAGPVGAGGGQRARTGGPAAAAAAAQASADALFTDPGPEPLATPRVGPVRVAELGGERGRGLVTSRTVQPGELLLAVRPLALAWDELYGSEEAADGSADMDPADAKFLELQRQLLRRRYSPREAAWLASLGGLPAVEAQEVEGAGLAQPLPQPPDLTLEPELPVGSDGAPGEGGGAPARDLPLPARLQDLDTLADVVQANCLEPDGGAEDEYAIWARQEVTAEAAGATPSTVAATAVATAVRRRGPMGLWPEAALLNHSCIPNTVAYVVGDTLFLRAARKVGGGSELTVSYLPVGGGYIDGSDGGGDADGGAAAADGEDGEVAATLLSPLAVRRAALAELRGFMCRCSRCQAEESLDPKLRALMSDISEGVAALRVDLQTALALADLDEEGEEGEEEEEGVEEEEEEGAAAGVSPSPSARLQAAGWQQPGSGPQHQRRAKETAGAAAATGNDRDGEGDGEEDEEEDEEGDGSRWRQMVGSVVDRAGLFLELMDAAMVKLKLNPAQQITAQSAVAPLYTVLWAALGARGELEPRLAEVMAALVGEVAPGSADHVWWAVVARETAEMIVAEEEALEEAPVVRRGSGGGGGFSRPQDDRVTIADKSCYKAFAVRYGPISRGVYRKLLVARREREDEAPGL